MVLDEPGDDDSVFMEKGITFMISKTLYEQVKPIKVDYVNTPYGEGFHISSSLEEGCGSCSC